MSQSRVSPATLAFVEQLVAYHRDPANAPHDNPPMPQTIEVAHEMAATVAQLLAIVLDFQATGELHADDPSPQARLAAAEMLDKAWPDQPKETR